MPWEITGAIAIGSILVLIALGMPVSFAFCVAPSIGVLLALGPGGLHVAAQMAHDTLSEFVLVTVPLFIFMAELLYAAGFSQDLYVALDKWFRRLPGGLLVVTITSCAAFSFVCGSSYVTAATIGRMALPELVERHYGKSLTAGTIAAGGTLGFSGDRRAGHCYKPGKHLGYILKGDSGRLGNRGDF